MEEKKILVIDDDPNICELLRVNLTAEGYGVSIACNGEEALNMIEGIRPRIVILDIMMPEIDGWEVCKAIRDDPDLEDIKILMLTAKDTDKDKMIGKHIFNADEYMTKPFGIEELLKTVGGLLDE